MNLQQIIQVFDAKRPALKVNDEYAYHCACAIAGRTFTRRTWQAWKRIDIGNGQTLVTQWRRELTFGETLVLLAIAHDRLDCHLNKPLPTDAEIWETLTHPLQARIIGEYADGTIKHGIEKKYLSNVLAKRGVPSSTATLYRRFGDQPWFRGRNRFYAPDIDRMVAALQTGNNKNSENPEH